MSETVSRGREAGRQPDALAAGSGAAPRRGRGRWMATGLAIVLAAAADGLVQVSSPAVTARLTPASARTGGDLFLGLGAVALLADAVGVANIMVGIAPPRCLATG